jgi:hypothetical protein
MPPLVRLRAHRQKNAGDAIRVDHRELGEAIRRARRTRWLCWTDRSNCLSRLYARIAEMNLMNVSELLAALPDDKPQAALDSEWARARLREILAELAADRAG